MDIRKINEDLSVSPQIEADDVAELAQLGFRTIICNRPDSEEAGQTPAEPIQAAAERVGIDFIFQPVISGGMTHADVQDFAKAMSEAEGPVLAYCRTGTRCTALWAVAQKMAGTDPQEILTAASNAGYDMSGLVR